VGRWSWLVGRFRHDPFLGVIIAVTVFFFRMLTSNRLGETRDAMEILKERYARGEIDEDEFRRRKQELQG